MILIADAGGTKTDWRLLKGDKIDQFKTAGFNPHTHDLAVFISDVKETFDDHSLSIDRIYFYGASIYPHNEEFKRELISVFPRACVELNNDLVGSCRALSAHDPGFVGIMGTGSAGCFYDGNEVTIHVPSMGHALGDEGSGAKLGVRLLKLALRKDLDEVAQDLFDNTFQLTKEDVYNRVYRGEHPNAYLASFAKFILEHKSHPQFNGLIVEEMEEFFEAYFMGMPDREKYPVHLTGSVAFHFNDYVRSVGKRMGFNIGHITQGPIAGLALFHQQYG